MPPRRDFGDRPNDSSATTAAARVAASAASSRAATARISDRATRDGEKRPFKPRGDRPYYGRDDRPPRSRDRDDARPAGRVSPTRNSATSGRTRRAANVRKRKFDGERKFSRGAPARTRR